jgi:NADPH:quinone reductase-like Zn-dependent oxidoreductase
VVIDVRAASANPIDGKIANGGMRGRWNFALPHVLGRECSGVVVGVGGDVANVKQGEAVWAIADQMRWGTHAQYVAIDAATVAHKPENLTHAEAAALPISGLSSWAGLVTAGNLTRGQRVLIHGGAGGVGSFAVQLAKHLGAEVAVTAREENHNYVASLGADVVIDYVCVDFSKKLQGYDLVFDLIGGDVRARSFAVLRPGGCIVHLSTPPMKGTPARADVLVKQAVVTYGAADLDRVASLVRAGVKPPVGTVLPFNEVAKAYELSMEGHARGKIVCDFGGTA